MAKMSDYERGKRVGLRMALRLARLLCSPEALEWRAKEKGYRDLKDCNGHPGPLRARRKALQFTNAQELTALIIAQGIEQKILGKSPTIRM